MINNKNFLALACLISMLTACDNDSDGRSSSRVPADAIAITTDNALNTAKSSDTAINNALSSFYSTSDTLLPKTSINTAKKSLRLTDFARSLTRKSADAIATGAAINETVNCDTGTISISADFTETPTSENGNGSITMDNCVYGTVSLHGSFSYSYSDTIDTGNYISGTGTESTQSLSITTATATHTITRYSLSYSYNDSSNSVKRTFGFSSSDLGGGVLFQDTSPWIRNFGDFYPHAGVTVITGSSNSKLRITALDITQFKLETDADGDDSYETSQVYTWSALYN